MRLTALRASGTAAAARQSMGITLFHWCLHPWALYAIVAMSLGYFGFRRGLPLSFRSIFYPLLGDRIHGRLGDSIDVLAILATLFGLATSLGFGADQINAGYAFCAQHKNKRRKSTNFAGAGFLAVDIDEGMTIDEALAHVAVLDHSPPAQILVEVPDVTLLDRFVELPAAQFA